MTDVCMFKRGADLKGETRTDDDDTVTCVDCGAREPDQTAYEAGWQLVPPVCPNCLRWDALTSEGVEAM